MKTIPNPPYIESWDGETRLRGVRPAWKPPEDERDEYAAGKPVPESEIIDYSLAQILRSTVLNYQQRDELFSAEEKKAPKSPEMADMRHGFKCLDAFEKAGEVIEMEDADYDWLKPILERDLPRVWSFNAPTILDLFGMTRGISLVPEVAEA